MSKKWELYEVGGETLLRKNRFCPRCGEGVFMAEHKNRFSCGACGYTEWKEGKGEPEIKEEPTEKPKKEEAKPEKPATEPEEKPEEHVEKPKKESKKPKEEVKPKEEKEEDKEPEGEAAEKPKKAKKEK